MTFSVASNTQLNSFSSSNSINDYPLFSPSNSSPTDSPKIAAIKSENSPTQAKINAFKLRVSLKADEFPNGLSLQNASPEKNDQNLYSAPAETIKRTESANV
jgi:hypothetical protein